MKKIKILHKVNAGIGGVEKYILNNMKHIDKNKYQFDFLTRTKNLSNTDEYRKYNFQIKYFSKSVRNERELFIDEINTILDEGYDVIHLHTSIWTGFILEEIAMKRKIPKVIVHSHLSGIAAPTQEMMEYQSKLHNSYKAKFSESLATDFCACSKSSADWLFGPQIPTDKIKLMKNAIEVDKYIFDEYVRKDIRAELGIEDCYVLGNVGRMEYQKNHQFLIDTFNEVYKRNKKARLLLIGSGEDEKNIKNSVNAYGLKDVVLFLGWRNDVNRLLQAMDLFLLPSHFEGFPIVLVEAQAAGLRCIASSNITEEIAITNNVKFVPLELEKWVDCVCEASNQFDRINMKDIITNAGYNIKYAIKDLEKLYEL